MTEQSTAGCTNCEFLGSDSCRDAMWFVCDNPKFDKEYTEGRTVGPDLKISPSWCPRK